MMCGVKAKPVLARRSLAAFPTSSSSSSINDRVMSLGALMPRIGYDCLQARWFGDSLALCHKAPDLDEERQFGIGASVVERFALGRETREIGKCHAIDAVGAAVDQSDKRLHWSPHATNPPRETPINQRCWPLSWIGRCAG
jgi:hypothetical protein